MRTINGPAALAGGDLRDLAGPLLLALAVAGAAVFFKEGLWHLFEAWQTPEYSHGPLIPILSGFMFLRQMRTVPADPRPVDDRWPGVALMGAAMLLALIGKIAQISDIVAYAMLVWIGGVVLTSFGWARGVQFWPPVLHLAFMLPLPGLFYYKVSTELQFISSELGVWLLQAARVPVYLEGNIIDLGAFRLHVAEACSGLRYLFPIMSFSYIFAVLYKGPTWHKAVLLISAAPIAVVMNSVRIALVGVMVNLIGLDWATGVSHFMEGWVIFVSCILILFGLARLMLVMQRSPMTLSEALDLDLSGLGPEIARLRLILPSRALIAGTAAIIAGAALWAAAPERAAPALAREPLPSFPRQLEDWRVASIDQRLSPQTERTLGADDYVGLNFVSDDHAAGAELFVAWYADQTKGGIHSPEICLPGGGWEMAEIEQVDVAGQLGQSGSFEVTRAIIQKGQARLLVYFWFDQYRSVVGGDFAAKMMLLWNGFVHGRTDGALVRLTTPIRGGDAGIPAAEARLQDLAREVLPVMPAFVPDD